MNLLWQQDKDILIVNDIPFLVTNKIRNELNGQRKLHDPKEVVKAIVRGTYAGPYMPRPFPKGKWNITQIEYTNDPEFAPVKIKTDAHQLVQLWALDDKGGYDHGLTVLVDDSGYYLHWSEFSHTTLGCGRVGNNTSRQVIALAYIIETKLCTEAVTLEVA